MYLPAVTVPAIMTTESTQEEALKLSPEVASSTASSIYIRWAWEGLGPVYVRGFRVNYHRISSSYSQQSSILPPTANSYGIGNLVADTYYQVCVTMYYNDTATTLQECVDAATTSWHIPVSIGSSIGAVLALSIIVLIVLLSRCPSLVRQPRTAAAESSKYDSMSSHFPDDRYEMSDTTTHCHDHDDDMFSHHSEDCLADSKTGYRHNNHHYSPQSLADRLCNGTRMINGVTRHARVPVPLGRVGRTLSLTDKRHHPNHSYRTRQARLAHLHANFHSIQSEPGSVQSRPAPRVSITDFPTSPINTDMSQANKPYFTSTQTSNTNNSKGFPSQTTSHRPSGFRENPRIMYKIESANSTSEPTMMEVKGCEPKARPPTLKNIPKTMHMSIDGDTLV